MKDPNSPSRLLLRRANQKIRGFAMLFFPRHRARLWRELMKAVALDSDAGRIQMARIHWRLGSGSVYHFTPDQLADQYAMAQALVLQIEAEEAEFATSATEGSHDRRRNLQESY